MSNRYHLIVFALAVALSLPQGADARNLYRYKNAEGTVVVNDQVPPEYVPGGY